jgi:N-terminal EH-domain containing protein
MADGWSNGGEGGSGSTEDRTLLIAARLKQLYTKSILPIEKKYRYDYFFDSPLLSDVEFDGTSDTQRERAQRQLYLGDRARMPSRNFLRHTLMPCRCTRLCGAVGQFYSQTPSAISGPIQRGKDEFCKCIDFTPRNAIHSQVTLTFFHGALHFVLTCACHHEIRHKRFDICSEETFLAKELVPNPPRIALPFSSTGPRSGPFPATPCRSIPNCPFEDWSALASTF